VSTPRAFLKPSHRDIGRGDPNSLGVVKTLVHRIQGQILRERGSFAGEPPTLHQAAQEFYRAAVLEEDDVLLQALCWINAIRCCAEAGYDVPSFWKLSADSSIEQIELPERGLLETWLAQALRAHRLYLQ